MAFLRFSRDKRGVENFYLVQPITNRRGKVRPRVLYWFRSPPDVRVGREPFDPELRRTLEKQNPDIDFDWKSIVETPIPSADADKWRERRRADRAAKHAAAAEAAAEAANSDTETDAAAVPDESAETSSEVVASTPDAAVAAVLQTSGSVSAPSTPSAPTGGDGIRKRRRRRRGGGRGGRANTPGAPAAAAAPSAEPTGD